MQKQAQAPDIQSVLMGDLFNSDQQPRVDGIKQVIDSLKDRVQPLTPVQMKVISYLEHLQSRSLHDHKKNKTYQSIIDRIDKDAHKVAPPGFFIRVIEALIPRQTYIDGKAAQQMARENEGRE